MNLFASARSTAPQIPWVSLIPTIIMFGGAVLNVFVEAFAPAKNRYSLVIGVILLTPLTTRAVLATRWLPLLDSSSSFGEYIENPLSIAVQFILALITFSAVLVMADRSEIGDGAFTSQPSDRPGSSGKELFDQKSYQRSEMFPSTLSSLGDTMLFPAADSYVLPFVALEAVSLPLCILVATARRRRRLSQEASLKYFVLDAFASAFLLMGSAFLYGFSGSLTISTLVNGVALDSNMDWLIPIGVFLVMFGFLFKVNVAPFHAWTPDVYTDAPTPITDLMAATVKVAAFSAVLHFYEVVAAILQWDLVPVLMGIAFLTILTGTFTGIVQSDVKCMLALSSIAHTGSILLNVFSLTKLSTRHVLFYATAYGVAIVGAFDVASFVHSTNEEGVVDPEATALQRWAGLGRKNPLITRAMLIFLLSLADIPLSTDFVDKFLVLSGAFAGGSDWFIGFALACSAVAAFYCFRLVHLMFFTEASPGARVAKSEDLTYLAVLAAAAATILLGVFPGPVLSIFSQAVILLP